MNKENFLWDTFGIVPKSVKEEDKKVYDQLVKSGRTYEKIETYLKYKKDLLLEHKRTIRSAFTSAVGLIAFDTGALYSTGEISNFCLGTAALFLGIATYTLVSDQKTRTHYNDASESLGLKFVKKM